MAGAIYLADTSVYVLQGRHAQVRQRFEGLLAEGATVLHYDADYDRIARITNQPMEWVAEKGSL